MTSATPPGFNWARSYRYSAGELHRPRSLEELQRTVAGARQVRALGTRHCFSDVADSPGDLVSLDRLPTVVELCDGGVRVSAATSYGVLAQVLHERGLALAAMASLPHISVAGAVATATHGSGDRTQNLAAAVRALELVGADGQIRRVQRGDDEFEASVVAIGALGIVSHLELDVLPAYEVRQDVYTGLSFDALTENFDAVTSASYGVSLFTDWTGTQIRQVWLKTRLSDGTDAPERLFDAPGAGEPLHPVPGVDVRHATEQLGVPGPWHERLPHFRFSFAPSHGAEVQAEYLVPRAQATAAVAALRELGPAIAPVLHVCEIRTVAADRLWLSSAYERDAVALHFTFKQRPDDVMAALADVEAALEPLDARPHWGKLFLLEAQQLEKLYPRLADFRSLVSHHDPDGKFANAFTERLGITG